MKWIAIFFDSNIFHCFIYTSFWWTWFSISGPILSEFTKKCQCEASWPASFLTLSFVTPSTHFSAYRSRTRTLKIRGLLYHFYYCKTLTVKRFHTLWVQQGRQNKADCILLLGEEPQGGRWVMAFFKKKGKQVSVLVLKKRSVACIRKILMGLKMISQHLTGRSWKRTDVRRKSWVWG